MNKSIDKVAVLGAGVMGAQLAGHLANAGIPSLLFDLTQDLSDQGIKNLTSLKPAPLFDKNTVKMIKPCNYDDHLNRLKEADWIIEAVVEKLHIKHKVFEMVIPHLKDEVIITTNTSGLSVTEIGSSLPESLQTRFILTHFFNPPRYLRLVEIVRAKADEEVVQTLIDFLENNLGKGIVFAKDTPNFIGNRIGVYGLMLTLKVTENMNMTVEEVDKLTGTIVGRPKSATFRTADLVGLDTLSHVAKTSFDSCTEEKERDIFQLPDYLKKLIDQGRLGQKTKQGLYKKTDEGILSLDFDSLEYKPQKRVRFDGYRLAKQHTSTGGKIKALAYSDDRAGKFFWEILSGTLSYSASRIPEISETIVNIDNAMKWGFGWELGPFEIWDAIGVQQSIMRMKDEGKKVPEWVEEMVKSGQSHFYKTDSGKKSYYHFPQKSLKDMALSKKSINLSLQKSAGNLIKRDWSASLIDLGDGILDVEFHSVLQPTLNPIDESIAETINDGLDLLESKKYRGMIIGHQGQNFCVGANLTLILQFCENKEWDALEKTVKSLQDLTQRIRFSEAPVVAAPFNLCLGGGFELIAPAARRVTLAELYIGAVEVGVGLIPGAGGNLRLLLNIMAQQKGKRIAPFQISQKALEVIGFAKVATSAIEAKQLGYLRQDDEIVMNSDFLIKKAKDTVLSLIKSYKPPRYRDDIVLPGKGGKTAIAVTVKGFRISGKISAHDELIVKKLAHVLTGGDQAKPSKPVDEKYLLDIEREAFISLAGEAKSQDRIRYMLKKGKPLRN